MKALTDKIIEVLKEEAVNEALTQDYRNGIEYAIYRIELEEKKALFEETARVVMKHLANPEKYHPHHRAIIDSTSAELLEGKESSGQTLDYITD